MIKIWKIGLLGLIGITLMGSPAAFGKGGGAARHGGGMPSGFTDGEKEEKLGVLHRLGQAIELKDRLLTFRLSEPYQAFARGKVSMVAALGSIEPLQRPLCTVESRVLASVIPIWYPR